MALDVDGVLSAPLAHERIELPGTHLDFWPVPQWKLFLRWATKHFNVVWCTCWFSRANFISRAAGVGDFPALGQSKFVPGRMDWKVAAVSALDGPVVWVEDGFDDEAKKLGGVILVKTDFKVGLTHTDWRAVRRALITIKEKKPPSVSCFFT